MTTSDNRLEFKFRHEDGRQWGGESSYSIAIEAPPAILADVDKHNQLEAARTWLNVNVIDKAKSLPLDLILCLRDAYFAHQAQKTLPTSAP